MLKSVKSVVSIGGSASVLSLLALFSPTTALACYGCGSQQPYYAVAAPVVQQVAVPVPVPYTVVQRVAVPVPQPYPVIQRVAVPVIQRVEVPVPQPYPVVQRVVERVEVPVEHHHHAHFSRCGDGLLDVLFNCAPVHAVSGCEPCSVAEMPYVVDQGPVYSGPGITRAATYIPPRRIARARYESGYEGAAVRSRHVYREPAARRHVTRAPHRVSHAPASASRTRAAKGSANGRVFNARAQVHVIGKKRVDIKLYRD